MNLLTLIVSNKLLTLIIISNELIMIFLFYYLVIAAIALAFLLLPMCQYILRPCTEKKKYEIDFSFDSI